MIKFILQKILGSERTRRARREQCKLIVEMIETTRLAQFPGVDRVIPARRIETPNQWFIALYTKTPEEDFPSTMNLGNGTELKVEVFDSANPRHEQKHTYPDRLEDSELSKEEIDKMNDKIGRAHILMDSTNSVAVTAEGRSLIVIVRHVGIIPFDEDALPSRFDGVPVLIFQGRSY